MSKDRRNVPQKPRHERAAGRAQTVARSNGSGSCVESSADHPGEGELSPNAKLRTANAELRQKVTELESANSDLENLLASIDVPALFLDRRLKLRRFTPATKRMLPVIDSNVGRPLADFARNFYDDKDGNMVQDAEHVLEDLVPRISELQDEEGRCFVRRIVPFRTDDDRIDGVVITFQDTTPPRQHDELERINELLLKRIETTARKAEVLEQELAEVADQERQRLGRDLHDSLSQHVTGASMLVAALRQGLPDDSPIAGLAEKLELCLQDAKDSLRRLMKGVFPVDVDANGLQAALDTLARETRESHGISCDFECPGKVSLCSNFVATQLFLMAREAVHNSVKHAKPNRIVIRLEEGYGSQLSFCVTDDGIGIPLEKRESGMGLHIMQYRCKLLGGVLDISTSDSGGTCIKCTVPPARASKAR